MAEEKFRSKHAFGALERVLEAISSGLVDGHDILFLKDAHGKPYIGWVEKDGTPVIIKEEEKVIPVDTLPEVGEEGKIYIFGEDGYFWNGTEFINLCKSTDLTVLEDEFAKLKADAEQMETKLEELTSDMDVFAHSYEKIKYEISHKPYGTLVNNRDNEIRVMCPANTEWTLQPSGDGADKTAYYIGFKAYAPSDDVMSFKEDLAEIISDTTMYYFENNSFAGIDDNGRKYSIVWLPVAKYDETSDTWTYYGDNSSVEKYIGWYYSVEWYNANGVLIASDCIRINLSNEKCHTAIKPSYITEAVSAANAYTDEQVAAIIDSMAIVEF